jgi:uncharacterized protein YodC (DUF2158 family)
MEKRFEIGDVVQLKSGGPKMTVTEIDGKTHVRTAWFGGSKLEHGRFPLDTITPYKEEQKS